MTGGVRVLRGQPHDDDGPVFREPWEAQAFAMTLALHQNGLFSWSEWSRELASQIARADADHGAEARDDYYRHWLAALERLIEAKGASTAAELLRFRRAWDRAADRTPHGQPIELREQDFDAPGSAE